MHPFFWEAIITHTLCLEGEKQNIFFQKDLADPPSFLLSICQNQHMTLQSPCPKMTFSVKFSFIKMLFRIVDLSTVEIVSVKISFNILCRKNVEKKIILCATNIIQTYQTYHVKNTFENIMQISCQVFIENNCFLIDHTNIYFSPDSYRGSYFQ